jgi:hypothetical protein
VPLGLFEIKSSYSIGDTVVHPVNSSRLCSAELLCNSAVFPDERESAAGRLKGPVWEDKPQSHKPTLRYNEDDTPLRGPAGIGQITSQRGPEPTGWTT